MTATAANVTVYAVAGALILIAITTMVAAWRQGRELRRIFEDDAGFLRELRAPGRGRMGGLARAVREHEVGVMGDQRVLSRPLPALRREFAEDEVAHSMAFSLGGMLTGLALIATFLLIAFTMQHDVSGAINESGGADTDGSTRHLADAVGLLGGKFLISAAGVLGSVLSMFATTRLKAGIFRRAEHPSDELLRQFSSVEAAMCDHLAALNHGVGRLGSIEVSVKALGNEVSANLKNVMKDALGEQLTEILRDTMVDVGNIATRVEQHLTEAFAGQMQALIAELRAGLEALRTSIDGQGQGQLDQILERLHDTVSGGFQGQSHKMVAALDSFGTVVPALEVQLRAMVTAMADDTQQRNAESTRMTQSIVDRVGAMMQAMDAQQAAHSHELQRLQAASAEGAVDVMRRLEVGAAAMVSNVVGASRDEIDAVIAGAREVMHASSTRYGEIEAKASNAAAVVGAAAQQLGDAARSVQALGAQIDAALGQAARGGDAMAVAAAKFGASGDTLTSAVGAMRDATEATRMQTREQALLLEQQRQHVRELEQVWPRLFDTYLAKLQESSDALARGWTELSTRLERANNSVGATFAENIEVLSESVDKLAKLYNGKPVSR